MEENSKSNIYRDLLAGALLAAMILSLLYPVVNLRTPLVLGAPYLFDLQFKYLPWKHFIRDRILSGEAPLWNPYILGGIPLMSESEAAPFYPPGIFFLLFPIPAAFNLLIAAHLLIAGFGTYLLGVRLGLRRTAALISAVTFCLSGPVILRVYAGHFPILCTLAWLPLLCLSFEIALDSRRLFTAALPGIVIALQVLAGHPQYLYYSLLTLILYTAFRFLMISGEGKKLRPALTVWLKLFIGVAVGVSLSAAHLVPLAEFIPHSSRAAFTLRQTGEYSFPPESLLTFMLPEFFGDSLRTPYWGRWNFWEMNAYVGLLPFVLALSAIGKVSNRHVPFFAFLAGASLLLALGEHTPLLPICHYFLPGFRLFRGHSKFICLTAFSLAILAGFGFQRLLEGPGPRRPLRRSLIPATAVLISLGLLTLLVHLAPPREPALIERFRAALKPLPREEIAAPPQQISSWGCILFNLRRALIFAAAGAALYLLRAGGVPFGTLLKGSVFVLVVADLFWFARPFILALDSRTVLWPPKLVSFFREEDAHRPFRLSVSDPLALNPNAAMIHKVFNLGGCVTNPPNTTLALLNAAEHKSFWNFSQIFAPGRPSPLLDLFGVKYLVVPEGTAPPAAFTDGGKRAGNTILKNPGARFRAFLVRETRTVRDEAAILLCLTASDFNPEAEILLAGQPPGERRAADGATPQPAPRITAYSPRRVTLEAESDGPSFLLLSDLYYPGWKASIDGKETPIWRADGGLRAVELTAGKHTVEFVYSPASFKVGAAISVAAILILALGSVLSLLVKRRTVRI